MAAATTDNDTSVIVDSDELLRVAENRLRAWGGNHGIVTFGLTDDLTTTALYPVDAETPSSVIEDARKVPIYSDLSGEWFAHNADNYRQVIWRNPDGSVLGVSEFGFLAGTFASIEGDVLDFAPHP